MQSLAFDGLRALFENCMIRDTGQIKRIFSAYSNLDDAGKVKLVQALAAMVESGGFESVLVQPIVEFIRMGFRENLFWLNLALVNVVSALFGISEDIVIGLVREVLPIISALIEDGRPEVMPGAVHLLVICATLQPAVSRKVLQALYPKVLAFMTYDDEPGSARGKVGESFASLIDLHLRKELPTLLSVMDVFFSGNDEDLLLSGTKMMIIIAKWLDKPTFDKMMANLVKTAMLCTDEEVLNVVIDIMKKVARQSAIDDYVVIYFSYWVLSESHPLFEKQSLAEWRCPNTEFFSWITLVIEKFYEEEAVKQLIPRLLDLCRTCCDELFTMAFDPIAAAYGLGLVDELPSDRLHDVCYKEVFTQHSTVALSFVMERMSEDPEFCAKLCEEWRTIKSTQVLWKCAISDALMHLAAEKQKVDLDIIKVILQDFPFKADFGYTESLARSIVQAFKLNPGLEPLDLCLLKSFGDFFLLDQTEFLEYHVDYDTQTDMRATIRRIIRKNRQYERDMTKYYQGNKGRLNKFMVLVQ
jgi:hypothetical protein